MKVDLHLSDVHLRLAQKIGLIVAALFAIYVMVGFWVAPLVVKNRLTRQLADRLGRKVTIDQIKLNPLVLSATTTNLMIHETDGSVFAGFKKLYVNVQLSSLFRWAGMIKTLRLTSPFGVLKLLPDGKMNIDDLIAKLSQPDPQSHPGIGLPRAIVARLEVNDGIFTSADLSGSTPLYDVITPITFTLENLSTLKGREGEFHFGGEGPIGGKFDLTGRIELNPPRIQGRFTTQGVQLSRHWEHIKHLVAFEIVRGNLGLSGDFFAAIDKAGLSARLENASVQLDGFELTEKGRKTVLIALPVCSINGIHADLATHAITIDSMHTSDARILSWLSADGTFAWQQIVMPGLKKVMEKKAIISSGTAALPTKPWQIALKKMEVTDWEVSIEDRTLTEPARISADGIQAVVENLSTQKDAQATVSVTMRINQAGQFKANGTASIDPLQADMTVEAAKIALAPFQPYVAAAVKASVAGGSASATGRIQYMGKAGKPQIMYAGEAGVEALTIQDAAQARDVITLARGSAAGIALELLPNRLSVSDVHLQQSSARLIMDKTGTIDWVHIFTPAKKNSQPGRENLAERLVNYFLTESKGPMPITVNRMRVERFTGHFTDGSVSPAFKTRMDIGKGTVSDFSSKSSARATFTLAGLIDRSAAFEATGQTNPMNAFKYTQIDVAMNDFGLASVSAYAGKYIGYRIDKGSLRANCNYKIDTDRIQGDNIITIDGLELGKKVNSPDALHVPVKLGVAVLKDKKGRIAFQAPVVGNIKDPHFGLAKAITSALTGTIKKAGTEPFAAINKIDGFTGKELSVVGFEFGMSALTEAQTKKLDALAGYLKGKDALILGIMGTADRKMDLAALMMAEPAEEIPLATDSQTGETVSPEAAGVEPMDDGRIEELARQRADRVKAYLIQQAGIDSARLAVKPVLIQSEPDGDAGRVEFSLALK